jgi:hypothetical protein
MNNPLPEAAQNFGRSRWRVFPVEAGGERPLISDWQTAATTDEREIAAWWTRWEGANIGHPAGALLAIKVTGPEGEAELKALEQRHGPLPSAVEFRAPRSRFLLFAPPEGEAIRNSRLSPHLDVIGRGGYIILPPSVHPSGPYQYVNRGQWPPAQLPGWVLAQLSAPQTGGSEGKVHNAVAKYVALGWSPVPVPAKSKGPSEKGWNNPARAFSPADFHEGENVGLRLGRISNQLADVDLDALEALRAAPEFLPPTTMRCGRQSKPESHYFYVTSSDPLTAKFEDPILKLTDPEQATLVELRANARNGKCVQTIVPPSVHPSGEQISWVDGLQPARVETADLVRAVKLTAVTGLIARYWPGHGEHGHDFVLALSGALLRSDVKLQDAKKIVRTAACIVGYSGGKESDIDDSARNLAEGRPVTGWPKLKELMDARVVDRIGQWLGLTVPDTKPSGQPEPEPEPATEIDGERLVQDVEAFVARYLVLPVGACLLLTLWALATYLADVFDVFPYLCFASPLPQCGKTRAIEVLELLCRGAWRGITPSEAGLFRFLAGCPSLLLDEVGSFAEKRKSERDQALLAILQAGYRKGATVLRWDMHSHRSEQLPVYSPKAFCLVGNLPDALADRCIVISMQRRRADQPLARFRFSRAQAEASSLKKQIEAGVRRLRNEVQKVYNELPDLEYLSDRDAELFGPLMAVCGVLAPSRVDELERHSQTLTCAKNTTAAGGSLALTLLADLKELWPDGKGGWLTIDMLAALKTKDDSPWAGDYELNPRRLAHLLKPFLIESKSVRDQERTGKGYKQDDVLAACSLYMSSKKVTESQPA